MKLLEGRRAIVTGAAQGLGEAIARAFVDQGARVVLADLDEDRAAATAATISGTEAAIGVGCDVADPVAVEQLVARTVSAFGGLDILVNNAGILRNCALDEATLADFRDLIDVHLQGAWLGIKYAAPALRAAGGGSIVNMSSIGGKAGLAGQTNYSAAKAGVIGLTKAAAKELAGDGIRVNAILPGIIETAMAAQLSPDDLARRAADIPLGRLGRPAEIADAAVYLGSSMASYVTGATLEVSGGRFM
ncbi:3-oxoacyl-ACP reductase FabG [Nocardioides sp. BP30]|uniref:3-oxoacyl-ACP reductase FabG n=1 Tax=Nocardioides sp. BP30 TaxID=3036374 RepID=UPI002468AD17|nr:3-oxoacyl-ACP reductase FabG [Nocardioides sp. BP30]WGL54146.1 3-oxoacyl-ACP reductase FabG [Nocardioides sp. BP30]